jgi:hypothetical protein
MLPADLRGTATELQVDQDGIVYVLTSKGVARLFGDAIALDGSYRPLASRIARDITTAEGELFYLFPQELLSNRRAGKFVRPLPPGSSYERAAVNSARTALLAQGGTLTLLRDGKFSDLAPVAEAAVEQIEVDADSFLVRAGDQIYRVSDAVERLARLKGLNTVASDEGRTRQWVGDSGPQGRDSFDSHQSSGDEHYCPGVTRWRSLGRDDPGRLASGAGRKLSLFRLEAVVGG